MGRLIEAVRQANAPKPAEDSVRLRVAAGTSIAIGLLAAAHEHEMSAATAGLSAVLMAAAMVFSHRTRRRSPAPVKVAVAVGALAAMAWFVGQLSHGPSGDITSVEDPLTILFAWILVVHSFHVPARRDLVFALAGSAALMAVAAAQAVDMQFGLLAAAWVGAALWTLLEAGAAAAGRRAPGPRLAGGTAGAVAVAAVVVFLLLPAPTEAVHLDFRSSPSPAGPVPGTGARAGDSGSPVQLSHPGRATGRIRVGGYLGFAGSLDTAVRGSLGRQVVMQVRASVPSFWIGETFDRWSGQSWSSTDARSTTLGGGSPFALPPTPGSVGRPGHDDLQTFYVEDATADLVFHADDAEQLWFPAPRVYLGRDDSIVSPVGIGKGTIYSVESSVVAPTAGQLRHAPRPTGGPGAFTQLPEPYADVRSLAESVAGGAPDTYDQVEALIGWIGAHTRYSTDIPPLAPGADAVRAFLFGNRTGYCEQISTALTVMLRTLGVPAREAVGYVPGSYNPLTDLYEVRADDAHAWVQVWFPGYGWVSFDPTAVVPVANPSPGVTALRIAGRWAAGLPWPPTAATAGALGAGWAAAVLARRRRARRRLPAAQAAVARMERAGRRANRHRRPSETVTEYAAALAGRWPDVAAAVDRAAYGGEEVGREEWRRLVGAAEAVEQ